LRFSRTFSECFYTMLKETRKVEGPIPASQMAIVPPPSTAATAPEWTFEDCPADSNSLDSFKSETQPVAARSRRIPLRSVGLTVALTAALLLVGWLGWQVWRSQQIVVATAGPVASTGTAIFNSVPEGASITIDGVSRGNTPVQVSLAPGTYTVQIVSGSATKTLPITVQAGAVSSQYVEFAAAPAPQGGRLEIGSDPSGANVRIDGVLKGVTPLTLNDVAPGQHRVTISRGENAVNRVVNVVDGATATIVVSTNGPPAAAASGGWLTVQTPVEMEIFEDGRLLGSTRTDRLMLPVGSHRLEIENPNLEFSTTRTVEIAAGRTVSVALTLPTGTLALNALPWANVSLNGILIGTTPLGDLSVPIGYHEVVFRHPQFGERRQSVIVKAKTPTRIGIDLRK
jgi:hypothetical protein